MDAISNFFSSYISIMSDFLLSEPFVYVFGFVIVCVIFRIISKFFRLGGLR